MVDLPVLITGAADVAANGYTISGQSTTSAVRAAEGKITVKFDRNFDVFSGVTIAWNPSAVGATLVRAVVDTANIDLAAAGGSVVPLWFYDGSGLLDPDSTVICCRFSFEIEV